MIIVDTDVLIAHLRGSTSAHAWLRRVAADEDLAISVVTVAEIMGGMRSAERTAVRALLSALPAIPVSEVIAARAGDLQREFRRSHQGISLGDYLIAGTADTVGATVATLNTRHLPMFEGLQPPFRP